LPISGSYLTDELPQQSVGSTVIGHKQHACKTDAKMPGWIEIESTDRADRRRHQCAKEMYKVCIV
jgi:hypothetical protein